MLLRLSYLWLRNKHVKRFLAQTGDTCQVQRKVLLSKLRRNAQSDFGREHGFSQIHSIQDFRRQIPLTDYEYYRPYVERVKKGNLGAMFGPGTKLLMFALTSGTTGESKYIPVTSEFFDEYRYGWNLWGVRTYIDHVDLCRKKTVQLSSDWRQFYTEGGTPCGSISGLAAATAPLISRPVFIIPRSLIRIKDPVAKQYTALRFSVAFRNVGMVVTANPSTLVGFARLADERREALVRDIFDGTLSADVDVPGEIRRSLRRRLKRRDPQRARELEQIIERRSALYPRDYWPGLSVLAVWTGGSVGAYLPRLREYYGQVTFRDHGLSASEGRMTLPLADNTTAGVLDIIHSYFEFIPEAEHDRPQPTVLEAHQLEAGENYFILLTTSSGFYRYDIYDLVRCVGFEGTAPVLEFLNKGTSISSITGEKISEFQVVSAVKSGFAELGLPIELFTIAPVFGDPPGYVLLLEPGPYEAKQHELARSIDAHLSKLNCEYADRLRTCRLRPLSLRQVAAGTWSAYREQQISSPGGSLEQYKHPCLVGDLQFIDRLSAVPTPHSRSRSRSGAGSWTTSR